jgi:hypothetical protein
MLLEPVFMSLDGQGADQAQAALRVGKDPHHRGAALNLFVEALEQVGALEMLMVLAWAAVEAQRFFQVFLDPGSEPWASAKSRRAYRQRSAGKPSSSSLRGT